MVGAEALRARGRQPGKESGQGSTVGGTAYAKPWGRNCREACERGWDGGGDAVREVTKLKTCLGLAGPGRRLDFILEGWKAVQGRVGQGFHAQAGVERRLWRVGRNREPRRPNGPGEEGADEAGAGGDT